MKQVLLLGLLLPCFSAFAQTVTGWHIIKNNTSFTFATYSGSDMHGMLKLGKVPSLAESEPLYVFSCESNQCHAFSADGAIVLADIQGLEKATEGAICKVGTMRENFELMGGKFLHKEDNVWIVGEDEERQEYIIQREGGKKIRIPAIKVYLPIQDFLKNGDVIMRQVGQK